MNNHPINLTVKFLLEIAAIIIFAMWGWQQEGAWKYLAAIGLPLLAMTIWGVFRVPGDPGKAPIEIRGILRLFIEGIFFGTAVVALFSLGYRVYGWMLLAILVVHFIASYDRIIRLLKT